MNVDDYVTRECLDLIDVARYRSLMEAVECGTCTVRGRIGVELMDCIRTSMDAQLYSSPDGDHLKKDVVQLRGVPLEVVSDPPDQLVLFLGK